MVKLKIFDMKLRISESLSLPLEAVTQTFAILAVKGSGKSYTASVCAEEMLKAGQQIVVIDMTGAWYGLKSSSDGKSDGFPIAVFGGDHADVPLHEGAGEIIASAIVEKKFSARKIEGMASVPQRPKPASSSSSGWPATPNVDGTTDDLPF